MICWKREPRWRLDLEAGQARGASPGGWLGKWGKGIFALIIIIPSFLPSCTAALTHSGSFKVCRQMGVIPPNPRFFSATGICRSLLSFCGSVQ